MTELVHVKGLAELQKFLDTLPPKIEKNIMRGALRAGANVVKTQAKANIHPVSGVLGKSLKVGTNTRGARVMAAVKTRVFYARFVEYGTRPHTITARDGGSLRFGGGFYKSVQHPGVTKAHAFLRPALDTQAHAAVIAVGDYIKMRLATKHGIDTSHIQVEGDES